MTGGGVSALLVHDDGAGPELFAGGGINSLPAGSGVSAGGLAKWDGTGWSALGKLNGTNREVRALAAYDEGGGPALVAGGTFDDADGVGVANLVRVVLGSAHGSTTEDADRSPPSDHQEHTRSRDRALTGGAFS